MYIRNGQHRITSNYHLLDRSFMLENVSFIVSLASYYKRIQTLHVCLNSLFSQTLKPKKIILYLDDTVNMSTLPKQIYQYVNDGLEIIQVSSELKSHNKYFYSLKEYSDSVVITVDDDVVYDRNLFSILINSYLRFPCAISAARVHYIMFEENGRIQPYQNWIFEYNKILTPSMRLFATGVGGILYPPNVMPQETFDSSELMALSLGADDIWLKFIQIRYGIPVVWSGQIEQHPPQIEGTKELGLYKINRFMNDFYINNLINYFNIDLHGLQFCD